MQHIIWQSAKYRAGHFPCRASRLFIIIFKPHASFHHNNAAALYVYIQKSTSHATHLFSSKLEPASPDLPPHKGALHQSINPAHPGATHLYPSLTLSGAAELQGQSLHLEPTLSGGLSVPLPRLVTTQSAPVHRSPLSPRTSGDAPAPLVLPPPSSSTHNTHGGVGGGLGATARSCAATAAAAPRAPQHEVRL